jgi:hypothetical protein
MALRETADFPEIDYKILIDTQLSPQLSYYAPKPCKKIIICLYIFTEIQIFYEHIYIYIYIYIYIRL